jgi:thioredoxin 1
MSNAIEVTDDSFQATVLESSIPVVVDFWATWCPPCRILGPIIDELTADYEGKALICKVDVDNNQALAQKYSVMSIPTILFFKDGEIKEQVVGALPKEQIAEKIDAMM